MSKIRATGGRQIIAMVALATVVLVTPLTASDRTTFIGVEATRAAFAKGQPLLETEAYKVHASRRDAPGLAEIHVRDTDIIYVLDGVATIVTGGEAVETRTVALDELRGSTITGGLARQLRKGDVFVIPNGVPHQFTSITGPFLYFVVKVTAPGDGGSR
jgi:Cupin